MARVGVDSLERVALQGEAVAMAPNGVGLIFSLGTSCGMDTQADKRQNFAGLRQRSTERARSSASALYLDDSDNDGDLPVAPVPMSSDLKDKAKRAIPAISPLIPVSVDWNVQELDNGAVARGYKHCTWRSLGGYQYL